MTANGWLQIGVFLLLILAITKPLGGFIARVFNRERTFLDPLARPAERLIYRLAGVDEHYEMDWKEYAAAILLFSMVSMLLLYLILRLQQWLPWNPQGFGPVGQDLSFNTAASFATNTNWQNYAGETTMSYFTQMAGLAYHNFVSAGTGIAVAITLIRGIARRECSALGNFWVDLTRSLLWLLLPISIVAAIFFVSQGTIQNFKPYVAAHLLVPQTVMTAGPGGKVATRTIVTQMLPGGPVASQEAIKMLGTNGGGFFGANSAHPFENPNPLTDFIQIILIFAIPSGLTYTLGRMTGSPRHGWAVWGAMAALFLAAVAVTYGAEARGNPRLGNTHQAASAAPGGNMEGKEVRFGIADSALFATVTTDASCGAVNSQHDSFTPLGGMMPLVNMMLGEVVFGGVGAGLYGMLVFVVLAVFIAGLMVGRTPEYLGKKIEAFDVKMAMLTVLIFCLLILVFTAVAVSGRFGTGSISNPGPHGLTQVLYAYTSTAANNGSAFGGLNGNTPWYNVSLGFNMLMGRFLMMIPVLALAGNLAGKKLAPASAGTFPVTTPLFAALLVGVVVVVGALTFFPALTLGPILEQVLLHAGTLF